MKLIFKRASYKRGDFTLLSNGSFGKGIHLVSGKVGSGKSTFALIAAGLIAPESGEVNREGLLRPLLSMQFPEYHITGISIQDEIRSWGLSVPEIISLSLLCGREEDDVASLSRGELKRLHLACVLSAGANLLILDEPFSALDCTEKKTLSETISGQKNGIVIVCTHEPLWLPDVDYIWEISDGTLTCCGEVPAAIPRWSLAPKNIRDMIANGRLPGNISPRAILETICRTRE